MFIQKLPTEISNGMSIDESLDARYDLVEKNRLRCFERLQGAEPLLLGRYADRLPLLDSIESEQSDRRCLVQVARQWCKLCRELRLRQLGLQNSIVVAP